ncbi:MAG: bifunctional YncE family protein/alkaline phosphatase family protein [Candidatus Eremiobacteraeota bacterium]|nr:bifunctional YncE family protein/alkaline phosphatase family protein [Candidatus Eremiobacteraeota bacterium]
MTSGCPIVRSASLIALLCCIAASSGSAELPNGQTITPLAAPGALQLPLSTGLRADGDADAAGATSLALSPDGSTLLLLTSGFNAQYFYADGRAIRFPVADPLTGLASSVTTDVTQWIFVYRVGAGGELQFSQHIAIPQAFVGLAWAPDSRHFYVSGGIDDRIAVYALQNDAFELDPPEILLGHNSNASAPLPRYDGGILAQTVAGKRAAQALGFSAMSAGLSVSADGRRLAVANMQNDSVSLIDTEARKVVSEIPLYRAGETQPHGEYPYGVAVLAAPDELMQRVYVSCMRDGEVDVVRFIADKPTIGRIEVGGEPNSMLLSADRSHLYVANGDLDEVDVIDTASDGLAQRISIDRPNQHYRGANPNALALDERAQRLYVTLGGENAVAVIDLATTRLVGRIPTGWYPTAIAAFAGRLAVADAKGPAGPNPGMSTLHMDAADRAFNPTHRNEYVLSLEKANLLSMPIPSDADLGTLSRTVDANNRFAPHPAMSATIAALRGKIQHVIYVMKENRTYDQVLGDLKGADGDPRIVVFPYPVTPNHHNLAAQFVTLDNFETSGDVSSDGWNWSQQGRANEFTMRVVPLAYAADGIPNDFNGQNRGITTAYPDAGGHDQFDARITTLLDPTGSSSILPGSKDIAATGYIWDSVLAAGKSVRHYGMYADATYYQRGTPFYIPIVRNAYSQRVPQAPPSRQALLGRSDLFYRGWDLNTPDRYRYEEWKREFDGYVRRGDLPAFESVELMMDHFGQFQSNVAGLNTPELQISDNDYALGRLIEAVSHSRYWKDTAIFVLEDDSQAGPDHVNPHRSIAYVISAYTRRHAVVHARYNTMTMLKTIEELLGVDSLGIFDANAPDMGDAFTTALDVEDRYVATIPGDLCRAPVDRTLIPECASTNRPRTAAVQLHHNGAWWIARTAGMNFNRPDAVDPRRFNALLQFGLR